MALTAVADNEHEVINMAKNPFSAVGAAAQLQARQGKVKSAVADATEGKSKSPPKVQSRKKEAPPVAEIRKTKHKGLLGEPSYGQKMKEPVMGKNKTRFSGDYE